ncbi:MAG: hypothetical protein LBR31_04585 [Desulfovibrio sp.]|jgi:hypothetical protein|nr:hypothetical protein [Desulfovibrio sp.]
MSEEHKEGFWSGNESGDPFEGQGEAKGGSGAEFELYMGAKSEVILGASSEVVGGEEFAGVLGAVQYMHAGSYIDFTLGSAMDGYVGHFAELGMAKTKAQAAETELEAMKTELHGNSTQLAGMNDRLLAQSSQISGLCNAVSGACDVLDGQRADVAALQTLCSAQNVQAVANAIHTLGQRTEALANACVTLAIYTGMAGQRTNMSGDDTNLGGTSTQLAGMVTIV